MLGIHVSNHVIEDLYAAMDEGGDCWSNSALKANRSI